MTLQERTTTGPAGSLTVWSTRDAAGDATPVLFIHPINMRGLIWADVAGHLATPRRCLMPDMRAHGTSDATGPFGLEEWTADLLAVVDDADVERFHAVGGSLGGPLACCLAAAVPERVRSITTVGSSLNFSGVDVEAVLGMFDRLGVPGTFRAVFPEITFAPGCPDEVIARGLELANPNDATTVKAVWLATITSDATAQAQAADCPAMVVTGEHDATCTPAMGMELARALRTEQTLMPGVGHMPMLERPARLAELIDRHLALAERAPNSTAQGDAR